MNNPLNNIPLNKDKSYVMATTTNGCEVYMPVTIHWSSIQTERTKEQIRYMELKKKELQNYLDWKDPPILPQAA